MKLSVSAYRAHASAHKKILSSSYHSQLNYGSTGPASSSSAGLHLEPNEGIMPFPKSSDIGKPPDGNSDTDVISPTGTSSSGHEQTGTVVSKPMRGPRNDDDNNSNAHSSDSKSPSQRKSRIGDGASDPDSDWTRSNQRWMKLRTTVQISSAIQKKPPLKREDSFLKRFSTRQIPETQETVEDTGSESASGDADKSVKRRRRYLQKRRSVVNPDENFYFYWLMMVTVCVLYNLWTLIVRQSFPELQRAVPTFWFICDSFTDIVFIFDILVQLRTGYLEQGLMVYDDKKLACHYVHSRDFILDMVSMIPLDLIQIKMGAQPLLRFTRFFKVYRSVKFYYIVESRTVWPNLWRVVNLIHILLILAHWFGCFYYLLSEAEGFQGDWVYPYRPGDYATLTRKYLGSLYWSTLTLTTIGDLPTPETNAEPNFSVDGPRSIPRRGIKSRLLQFGSSYGYIFTIVSYLIGVFIFATIVGQVGNVITNRNANRLEFERLLDGAKTYMRHHKVPGGMKRRVLRWYDYSWSRGRIQGGGDINTALGLLPDKLKTELALHVNLSVLKKVTIFQECQPEFLHDLVLKMKAYIFTPGDSICRKGEVAREMFIIADGILEVLSETGKVLTTMKAGDFFGEIGILNLDGLNKRTADVRSVGYSELFSLSREDVLAAMKDYPEAQEILQTLGRKRLMEVRCVNKKYAKAQSDKEAAAAAAFQAHHGHGHVNQSDSSENSASKKIVDKLRHDVKGIRNVLKKTRTSRRSDESLEMQPLHSISPKGSKSMLKRMSRVRSDEKEETAEEKEEHHDKTPSPIGAGLPLLQRLRLLKEKQDREERAVKSTPPQKSPPHSHVTCTLSPQESIQEEPEREINEGLPLIQRLQHLKQKHEPPTPHSSDAKTAATNKIDVSTIAGSSTNSNSNSNSASNGASGTLAPSVKPLMKVSFKQRIQQMQSVGNGAPPKSGPSTGAVKKEPPKTLAVPRRSVDDNTTTNSITITSTSNAITSAASILASNNGSVAAGAGSVVSAALPPQALAALSNKLIKPSIKTTTTSSVTSDTDTPIKPWSKLKLATLISSSYTSLTNCSPDELATPLKNYSLGNIPGVMKQENVPSSSLTTKTCLHRASFRARALVNAPNTNNSNNPNLRAEVRPSDHHLGTNKNNTTKFYQSVFDLSPEYSGLPFVKRLKILNERQKLAELEKALQTRSFSLDSSKNNGVPITESLYRCYSDTSGIYSQFLTTYESSSTTSTNTSTTSEHSRRRPSDYIPPEYSPLSPESNETVERRKLKSILKKLHKSREQGDSAGSPDDPPSSQQQQQPQTLIQMIMPKGGLPREPTLEGPPSSAKATATTTTTFDDTILTAAAALAACESKSLTEDSHQTYYTASPLIATPVNSPQDFDINNKATNLPFEQKKNNNFNQTGSKYAMPPPLPLQQHRQQQHGTELNKFNSINPNTTIGEMPLLEGLPGSQEYFNQILSGINNVIKTHINDMHVKFESQFSIMACEVRRRDEIIAELQSKLRNMELKTQSPRRKYEHNREKFNKLCEELEQKSEDHSSSGSSAELLFMRGDSLDTVFTSSPPIQAAERHSASPSTSKLLKDCPSAYLPYQHYQKPNSYEIARGSKTWSDPHAMMISDVTGNLTRLPDSVILDIGESSSSSSESSSKLHMEYDEADLEAEGHEEEDEEEEEIAQSSTAKTPRVHHNDWEVRMLAAELEKQERKRGHSLSLSDNVGDLKHCSAFLRRRRKLSDTETELSETDAELEATAAAAAAVRPRASSLDQFNLRYGIGRGIFKAMSIDRDKDKL